MMRVLVSYPAGHRRRGLVSGWTPYGAGESVPDAVAEMLAVSARSHGAEVRLVSTGPDPAPVIVPPPAAPGMLGLWSR